MIIFGNEMEYNNIVQLALKTLFPDKEYLDVLDVLRFYKKHEGIIIKDKLQGLEIEKLKKVSILDIYDVYDENEDYLKCVECDSKIHLKDTAGCLRCTNKHYYRLNDMECTFCNHTIKILSFRKPFKCDYCKNDIKFPDNIKCKECECSGWNAFRFRYHSSYMPDLILNSNKGCKILWSVLDRFDLHDVIPDLLKPEIESVNTIIKVTLNEAPSIDEETYTFDISKISNESLSQLIYILCCDSSCDRIKVLQNDKFQIECKIKYKEIIVYLMKERVSLMKSIAQNK